LRAVDCGEHRAVTFEWQLQRIKGITLIPHGEVVEREEIGPLIASIRRASLPIFGAC